MDNCTIARQLQCAARQLEAKHSNLYRVRAFRRAAQTVLGLERPVEELLTEAGRGALRNLPGIGASLSSTIETLVRTGEIPTLHEEAPALIAV